MVSGKGDTMPDGQSVSAHVHLLACSKEAWVR
jgi:hypothetical protein